MELDIIDFDLVREVEEVCDIMTVQAEEKGIELVCQVDCSLPPVLSGDAMKLRQILLNLTANAIKFTSKGGVSVKVETVKTEENIFTVKFYVSDTGIGISQEGIKRLFQSFSQVDPSTTRKYGGTGLGLAISKKLTEIMGGELGVTSEEGKGATFWFTTHLDRRTKKKQNIPARKAYGRRVLLAGLSDSHDHVISEYLSFLGCEVNSAKGAGEALEMIAGAAEEKKPFHQVFIDWDIEAMGGLTLAEKLRNNHSMFRSIPVIVMSKGNTLSDSIRAKGFEIITKPVKFGNLCKTLDLAHAPDARTSDKPFMISAEKSGLDDSSGRDRRILVAEDNVINQRFLVTVLKDAGYSVQAVNQGNEVLDAIEADDYDLIIMDVQMPKMDGIEATRAIRRRDVKENIPIIALTAHAMEDDRKRCLDAGMDDYISKPVEPDALIQIIEKVLSKGAPGDHEDHLEYRKQSEMIFDREKLMKRLGDKEEIAREIINIFLSDAPAQLESIAKSAAENDFKVIERMAHRLKGSAATICAESLTDKLVKIEKAARDMNKATVELLVKEAENCICDLFQVIKRSSGKL